MDGCIVVLKHGYWPLLDKEDFERCIGRGYSDWDHVGPGTVANGFVLCPSILANIEGYVANAVLVLLHVEDLGIEHIPRLQCLMSALEKTTHGEAELRYLNLNPEKAVIMAHFVPADRAARLMERMLNDLESPTIVALTKHYDELLAVFEALGMVLW